MALSRPGRRRLLQTLRHYTWTANSWTPGPAAQFPTSAAASTRSGPDTRTAGRPLPVAGMASGPDRRRADLERGRTAGQVQQDMTTALVGTEPELEADYPSTTARAKTAHDLTSNHNDGTLAGPDGDLPTWVIGSRPGHRPRRRWDHLQLHCAAPGAEQLPELPDRRHRGRWVSSRAGWAAARPTRPTGSTSSPAPAIRPGGAGEAQDYLGSLEVTTDGTGPGRFRCPVLAAGRAARRDRHGDRPPGQHLGGLGLRQATLQAPTQYLGDVPGQPLIFSTASGDGIAIQDPDAGPFDPVWNLTLSVAAGTLDAVEHRRLDRLGRRERIIVLQRLAFGSQRGA